MGRAIATEIELNLQSLPSPSRREGASRARAMTAYLGRLCGQIPYARTVAYFNRDGSSVAKDVRALDQDLRHSKSLRGQLDCLARRLITTSLA